MIKTEKEIPIKFNFLEEIQTIYPKSYYMPSKDYCIIIPELESSYTYKIDKKTDFKKEIIFIGKEKFVNDNLNLPRTKIQTILESLFYGYKTPEELLKEYNLPLPNSLKDESYIISDNVFFIYIRKPFLPTSKMYNISFKGFFDNPNPLLRKGLNTKNITDIKGFYIKDGKGPKWLMDQIKSQSFKIFNKDLKLK